MAVVSVVLKRGLGIFLQLFGEVGAGRGRGHAVPVAVVRDLQLLDEAHGPAGRRERVTARPPMAAGDTRLRWASGRAAHRRLAERRPRVWDFPAPRSRSPNGPRAREEPEVARQLPFARASESKRCAKGGELLRPFP